MGAALFLRASRCSHVDSIDSTLDKTLGKTVRCLVLHPSPSAVYTAHPLSRTSQASSLTQKDQLHIFARGPGLAGRTANSPRALGGKTGFPRELGVFKPHLCNTVLGLPLRWGVGCFEGEGAILPPELPPCLVWPLTLPMVPASTGPQEGCPGLGHRGGTAIYS